MAQEGSPCPGRGFTGWRWGCWRYLFLLMEPDGVPALLLIRHADGNAGSPVFQPGSQVMLQAAGGGKISINPSPSAAITTLRSQGYRSEVLPPRNNTEDRPGAWKSCSGAQPAASGRVNLGSKGCEGSALPSPAFAQHLRPHTRGEALPEAILQHTRGWRQGPSGGNRQPPAPHAPAPRGLTLMMTQSAWPRAQGSHFTRTSRLGFQWKSSSRSPAVSTEHAWHRATRHGLVW